MLPAATFVSSHDLQALADGGSIPPPPPVAFAEHLLTQSCAGRWIQQAVRARCGSPAVTLGCREDLAVCQLFDLI